MDCLIIGAGVVGLSLAYEVAKHGLSVSLIERGLIGREASWAGAGILPPARCLPEGSPYEQLHGLSNQVHRHWSTELSECTGIDNGYRECGGLYLSQLPEESAELAVAVSTWRGQGIKAEAVSPDMLFGLEPSFSQEFPFERAVHLPEESQLRNPRHLKALTAACIASGVEVLPGIEAQDFELHAGRINRIQTTNGPVTAGTVCVTTGSFSRALGERLRVSLLIKPIRGQIALLTTPAPVISRVINVGKRYLVPRTDGRLLIGSTEEDVGFNRGTTAGVLHDLLSFGTQVIPALREATLERHWAGLRPATVDGLPYLGSVPGVSNAFFATGHFRSGLQLSTGTAIVMSHLIRGERPPIDLTVFRLDRH